MNSVRNQLPFDSLCSFGVRSIRSAERRAGGMHCHQVVGKAGPPSLECESAYCVESVVDKGSGQPTLGRLGIVSHGAPPVRTHKPNLDNPGGRIESLQVEGEAVFSR
jgi:hypothetical protein